MDTSPYTNFQFQSHPYGQIYFFTLGSSYLLCGSLCSCWYDRILLWNNWWHVHNKIHFFPSFSLMEQLMTLIGANQFCLWNVWWYYLEKNHFWIGSFIRGACRHWKWHRQPGSSAVSVATNSSSLYEPNGMYILLHVFMGSYYKGSSCLNDTKYIACLECDVC